MSLDPLFQQILAPYAPKDEKPSPQALGMANNWSETPTIVMDCLWLEHPRTKTRIGSCLSMVSCDVCNYYYEVDSSD